MEIFLVLHGQLRDYLPGSSKKRENTIKLTVKPEETVGEIITKIGIENELVAVVVMDGEIASVTSKIGEQKEIVIFPALAGG